MTHVLRINLALLTLALVTGFSALATAADEPPPPQTIDDALLPVEELNLLLKPLTRSQLLVEADAWQGLLEDKAKEISALEILIKRGNRYIEDSDTARETSADMAEELKEAQAALDSAEEGETERAAKKRPKRSRNWRRASRTCPAPRKQSSSHRQLLRRRILWQRKANCWKKRLTSQHSGLMQARKPRSICWQRLLACAKSGQA